MATTYWPPTLPIPSSANFEIEPKKFSDVLKFQSGRRRVVQRRISDDNSLELSASMTFRMTLDEYAIFADFYDTYWKTFQPQTDVLGFIWGSQVWTGYPTSSVKTTRSANGWSVAFQMELMTAQMGFSFTDDEANDRVPAWPEVEFGLSNGLRFDRESRDETLQSDEDRVVRTNVSGDNFVIGDIVVERSTFPQILRLIEWWGKHVRYGAKPFKLVGNGLDLGKINGRSKYGWYHGHFLAPPKISFDGYFGQFSASVSLQIPNPDTTIYYQDPTLLKTVDVSSDFLALNSANIMSATDITIYISKGAPAWPPL